MTEQRHRQRFWIPIALLAGAIGLVVCGPVPVPAPQPPGPAPAPAATWLLDVIACSARAENPCQDQYAIAGASIQLHFADGYHTQTASAKGYTVWTVPSTLVASDTIIDAPGYTETRAHIDVAGTHDGRAHNVVYVQAAMPPLPPAPTRDDLLNVHITFQGLMVHCDPYGDLPWFEAALPWLSPTCRQAAYTAKHASSAWPGGDTHAIIQLPSGPPLYNDANQPYSPDRCGPLAWTAGGTRIDGRLADLVAEVARAGFPRELLFLGGDDGEAGFPIAMRQLDLVHDALLNSAYGDLRGYVVPIPGWDGVFYGYTPQHIYDWGNKCRSLFPYCGLEHQTGHIPAGEGPGEWWAPNGPMSWCDLLLSEFNDDQFDDTVWQIAARLLGPAYRRPPNQPSGDDPNPPFYMRDATDRGPIVNCAFEYGEFGFVHGQYDAAHVNTKQRPYFQRIGYTCGG